MKKDEQNMEKQKQLIVCDINRSFYIKDSKQMKKLINLITFGIMEIKHLDYTQGMNFIAKFCQRICPNENDIYILYKQILTKRLWPIFEKDLTNLECYAFVLDCLLIRHAPDVWDHLSSMNVKSMHFSLKWVLTVFTSIYFKEIDSIFVKIIWDLLIADGIKAIFKSIVLVIQYFGDQLKKMHFEKILIFFNELTLLELFSN